MPLQILSPNREAGDLLGKNTNLLWLLAGLSHHHPTLPEPTCQGAESEGVTPILSQSLPNLQPPQPNGLCPWCLAALGGLAGCNPEGISSPLGGDLS